MIKNTISVLFGTMIVACSFNSGGKSSESPAKNDWMAAPNEPLSIREQNMLKGLSYAFAHSNYCALVKETIISKSEIENTDKLVCVEANVYKVYKGESSSAITYIASMNEDEYLELNPDTVILCLCKAGNQFSWQGVGFQFPDEKVMVRAAQDLTRPSQELNQTPCAP